MFSPSAHGQEQGNAQAMQLMQQGKIAEAERYFSQATVAALQFAEGFLALGLVQLREGKPDAAEASLAKAIALNPELQGAHMFLGIAKYQMREVDETAANLRESFGFSPRT